MSVVAMTNEIGTPSAAIAAKLSRRLNATHRIHDDIASFAREKVVDLVAWQDRREEHLDDWTSRQAIVQQVFDAASCGRAILQGFCAPLILARVPGVVRVRIIASIEARAMAVVEACHCADVATAVEVIRDTDARCAGFAQRVFNADVNAPDLYDITVNSDRISIDEAVTLICDLAQVRANQPPAEGALESVLAMLQENALDQPRLSGKPYGSRQSDTGKPSRTANASAITWPPTAETLARAEEALFGKLPYGRSRTNAGNAGSGPCGA